MTKVVHCKKAPSDIYIGRGSKWGNPYSHKEGTQAKEVVASREEAISRYEEYLLASPELMAALHELRGKTLGCWCKPLGCHGDVLAKYADMQRVAVIGSRTFTDKERLFRNLDNARSKMGDFIVVSGGAKGADSLAEEWADTRGLPKIIFHAEWEKYGKAAGFKRNAYIIDTADMVLAYHDGQSRGTAHSIDLANKAGKKVVVKSF